MLIFHEYVFFIIIIRWLCQQSLDITLVMSTFKGGDRDPAAAARSSSDVDPNRRKTKDG